MNTAGSVDAKAEIKMPDTFIVSLAHGLNDRVELLGDVSWTGWSSIPKVDIVRASGAAAGHCPGVKRIFATRGVTPSFSLQDVVF